VKLKWIDPYGSRDIVAVIRVLFPDDSKHRPGSKQSTPFMKTKLVLTLSLAALVLWIAPVAQSQDKATVLARYDYAVVKWDGPDRLYYNLPDKFELVYLSRTGVQVPKDAQAEEWCLAYAANKMAKDGWEPINLDSRRILFRRAK
jgi:hypothetical protein